MDIVCLCMNAFGDLPCRCNAQHGRWKGSPFWNEGGVGVSIGQYNGFGRMRLGFLRVLNMASTSLWTTCSIAPLRSSCSCPRRLICSSRAVSFATERYLSRNFLFQCQAVGREISHSFAESRSDLCATRHRMNRCQTTNAFLLAKGIRPEVYPNVFLQLRQRNLCLPALVPFFTVRVPPQLGQIRVATVEAKCSSKLHKPGGLFSGGSPEILLTNSAFWSLSALAYSFCK